MPDWNEIVQDRLGPLGLAPEREAQIIAELAAHLAELYDDFRRQGWSEKESVRQAIASVSNWPEIGRRIRFAEEEEGAMNQRIRSVWLPGLCAVAMFYLIFQLLGFISMSAKAYPPNLKLLADVAGVTYFLGVIGTGAGAAYLSRRMGGGTQHQVLGALLPAGMWVVLALISLATLPQVKIAYPQMKFDLLPAALLLVTLVVTLPLLVGALLVILHSRWSNRVHPDTQSGSGKGMRKQTVHSSLKDWMHRFRLSHA